MASWLEDVLASLQQGGAPAAMAPMAPASPFPPVVQPATPEEEAAAAAAAREAAGARMARANQRRINPFGMPDMNSAGIQLAMDQAPAGTGVPVAPNTQFQPMSIGIPSLQAAKEMTAPPPQQEQPPSPVPMPMARPATAPQGAEQPDGSTDVSAARRAPVAAPMSIAPQMPASEPGIGDRLKSFAPALLAAGAALQGDNSVAAGMIKQQQERELLGQQANLTAQALLKKGVPPEDVAAAIRSPELLKALIAQNYGKDKVKLEKFKDSSGRETAAWVNPDTQTITPVAVPGQAAPGEVPALSDAQNNRVKAIIEGREPYPSPNTRSGDAQLIREAVHAADPNFDAVNYNSRQQTRKNFTSGKAAGNVTAFNTAIGHLGTLYDSIDGLGNRSSPWWNAATRPISENTDTKYASNVKKFETARTAVADELTRAFRGSGGNVHDIIQWEKAINAADSPEALRSAVRQAAELLNSRIVSLGDEYNRGMGTTKSPMELLNPKAAQSFQHLLEGGRPESAAPVSKGTVNIGGKSIPWSIN